MEYPQATPQCAYTSPLLAASKMPAMGEMPGAYPWPCLVHKWGQIIPGEVRKYRQHIQHSVISEL